jgi:hypothetical protein
MTRRTAREAGADERTAAAWAAYPQTVLELYTEPRARIDLRAEIDEAGRRALRSLGWPEMAVLTPANPCGEPRPAAENARRLAALERRLGDAGSRFVRVDGHAPDGSHCEPCVGIAMPREDALALAREHEQLALFHWDGASFWLLGAAGPYSGVVERLPLPPPAGE